jgi:SARP family transcriptional regulator, regulator of embCAB operon
VLHVRLFGTTGVVDAARVLGPADFGGIKPRRLLEALALGRGHAVTKDRLVDVLWGEHPPRNHVATLESYVSVLRRRLQPGTPARRSVIRTVPGGYLLDPAGACTDLDVFDTVVALAGRAPRPVAWHLMERASALGALGLLPSSDAGSWVEPVRSDYRQRALSAALRGGELALACDAVDGAARLARRALGLDYLCEPAWRLLMRAYAAAGRRDAAVRAYVECRRLLRSELGLEPAQETRSVLLGLVNRPPSRTGQPDDLGTVLDAAIDLFHQATHTPYGEPHEPPGHAAWVMAGLLRRAGVRVGGVSPAPPLAATS